MKQTDRWSFGSGLGAWWRAAALAAVCVVASGCAGNRIGKDWQCPMVQGVPCQSVVEADPAGPGGQKHAGVLQSAGALQGAGASLGAGAGQATAAPPGAKAERQDRCVGGCRPFGWLRRALAGDGKAAAKAAAAPADARSERAAGRAEGAGPENLRTPEAVGRIWIAPYVDAAGVYHEAAWVRVVLEPARWILP